MASAHPLDPYHAKRHFGATPEPAGGASHETAAPGERQPAWPARLPQLVAALATLAVASAWIAGEIVVAGAAGAGDFQALQNAFERTTADAAAGRAGAAIQYYAFDLPYLDGADLTQRPLVERRAALGALLAVRPQPPIRFSVALDDDPAQLLEAARLGGLEGLIGKRRDSPYLAGCRSPDWIKLKVRQRQEFVVGGWTDPQGSRSGLGALLLGVYDDAGALRYAGNVGTGFSEQTLADLQRRLAALACERRPFADAAPAVAPQPPKAAARPKASATAPPKDGGAAPAITHPERIVDAASGVTKGQLAAYYAEAAELMLPHLRGRALSLLRAPAGVGHKTFFQRHAKAARCRGPSCSTNRSTRVTRRCWPSARAGGCWARCR